MEPRPPRRKDYLYRCWTNIKQRCLNSNSQAYSNYGARGIKIYPLWEHDFNSFASYVGDRPSKKHSLDRIDNDRNYEPGNLRWATKAEQTRNSRRTRLFTYNNETRTLKEWSTVVGIPYKTLKSRLQKKWTIESLFNIPKIEKGYYGRKRISVRCGDL
jgi:hypothetical protein